VQVTNEEELTFWNEEEFVDARNGVCAKLKRSLCSSKLVISWMHQTTSCKLLFNYTTNIITWRFSIAGSKEHLRCINAEILLVIVRWGKFLYALWCPVQPSEKYSICWMWGKQGWEKPVFFLNNPPVFLNIFFGCFKKKQDFVIFLKKTEKAHSELFLFHHAISLFSELHNNN